MPPKVKCPTCRAETEWEGNPHRPFCSERCRLVDLGAWVDGRYRIPGKKGNSEKEEKRKNGSDPDESS